MDNKSERRNSLEQTENVATVVDNEQPVPIPDEDIFQLQPINETKVQIPPLQMPPSNNLDSNNNINSSYCNRINQSNQQNSHLQNLQHQQQYQEEKRNSLDRAENNYVKDQENKIAEKCAPEAPLLATGGNKREGMPVKTKKTTFKTRDKINGLVDMLRYGDGNRREAAAQTLANTLSSGDKQAILHAARSDCFKLMTESIRAKICK